MRHALYRDGRVFDRLPVYRLGEEISDESSLSGCAGDILIGGGSGEANALCFSVPEIFTFYNRTPEETYAAGRPAIKSYWTADDAFMFGVGFEKMGWSPDQQPLFNWLTNHLTALLARAYPDQYSPLIRVSPLSRDGNIFTDDLTL
jgi:hypothetical protein